MANLHPGLPPDGSCRGFLSGAEIRALDHAYLRAFGLVLALRAEIPIARHNTPPSGPSTTCRCLHSSAYLPSTRRHFR